MEQSPGDNTMLSLMRAELDGALSRLEVRLIDRFASKHDNEVVHERLTKYQTATDERFASVEKSIGNLAEWRNRIVGAIALVVFVVPLVVTLVVYHTAIFGG